MTNTWTVRLAKRSDRIAAIVDSPLLPHSRETYRRWLSDLYGFLTAFEARFAFASSLDLAFIETRIRSGTIAMDLLALGLDAAEFTRLAQRCSIPDFTDPIDALGWLIVVERIVACGPPTRRKLQGSIPRELAFASAFLRACEQDAEARSIELDARLSRWVITSGDATRLDRAMDGALACFEAWMAGAESTTVSVDVRSA